MKSRVDLLIYMDELQLTFREGKQYIYCVIRKKLLVLQPEEIVRQLFLNYLIKGLEYPISKIAVEKGIRVNGLMRRFDILIYNKQFEPWLLVECKSMYVELSQDVMDQASHYNLPLGVDFMVLTNGKDQVFCQLNEEQSAYEFITKLPSKSEVWN